jgi:hypothetical protein
MRVFAVAFFIVFSSTISSSHQTENAVNNRKVSMQQKLSPLRINFCMVEIKSKNEYLYLDYTYNTYPKNNFDTASMSFWPNYCKEKGRSNYPH